MNRRSGYSAACVERFNKVYVWICRFFGLLTATGLWGIGAETLYDGHLLGIYLIAAAVLVSFTECLYPMRLWVALFLSDDHKCLRCCDRMQWIDSWKKGILYLLLSAGCFVRPIQVWMAMISGAMLCVSSLLYFLKTFSDRRKGPETAEPRTTYNRFDDRIDDLEEGLGDEDMNGLNFPSVLSAFALAEQEEILTV